MKGLYTVVLLVMSNTFMTKSLAKIARDPLLYYILPLSITGKNLEVN
jgi:hypothetical protein